MSKHCKAKKMGLVPERGKTSLEWYKDGKPQYYCYGRNDSANDELLEVCKKCECHVLQANKDMR